MARKKEWFLLLALIIVVIAAIAGTVFFARTRLGNDGDNNEDAVVRAARSPAFLDQGQRIVCAKPRILQLDDFLSASESDQLVKRCQKRFKRSVVVNLGVDKSRTSFSCFLRRGENALVRTIEKKVSDLTGRPISHIEPLQVVRYRPGERYKAHFDYFSDEPVHNQRLCTFFVYLVDTPDGEAGTHFPNAGVTVTPRKGRAAWWYNVTEDGRPDTRTLHEGLPPKHGIKYGMNVWVRERPYVR